MKTLMLLAFLLSSVSAFAFNLVSGDYDVYVQDRHGRTHNCTFNIQHDESVDTLLLNITDCPPPVVNVLFHTYDGGALYSSQRIPANTDRGGYMLYEIRPLSDVSFEMTSHREYGDGGVNQPRKIVATKR